MTWLKLQHAGETATLFVKQCGEVEGRLGPQLRFQSDHGEDVYLPLDIGRGWLLTLGLVDPATNEPDYNQVCGRHVTFARVPSKDGGARPWWNLTLPAGPVVPSAVSLRDPPMINDHLPPATGVASPPAMESKAQRREAIEAAYAWAQDVARRVQREQGQGKGGVKPTAESIEQGVMTLMLRAERSNAI